MREHRQIQPRELALLLLLGVLWGVPFALTKLSLESIPPVTLTAARVALAALVLWVIVFGLRYELPRNGGLIFRLFVQCMLGCVFPYTFIALGQLSVNSGTTAILNSITPLFVYLISLAGSRHERTTLVRLTGAVVGLGGVVLVVGADAVAGLNGELAGQAAILIATFSSAVSVIHGRRFAGLAPEIVAAGTLTCAAVLLIPASLWLDAPWRIVPSSRSVAALVVNAVFATALGFVLYFRLIRTIGSLSTSSTSYLKPAVSVLIGCALLGEPLTWSIAVGLVAVVMGVAAINDTVALPLLKGVLRFWERPGSRGTARFARRNLAKDATL